MTDVQPCLVEGLTVADVERPRIPYGHEGSDWWLGTEPPPQCHDCGVTVGGLHHMSCDMEMCPNCGGQFLSCGCD
jgi:hypothetical protein